MQICEFLLFFFHLGLDNVWNGCRHRQVSNLSPEFVDVLVRDQVLDEKEAILLVEESLLGGQYISIKRISTEIKRNNNQHPGLTEDVVTNLVL